MAPVLENWLLNSNGTSAIAFERHCHRIRCRRMRCRRHLPYSRRHHNRHRRFIVPYLRTNSSPHQYRTCRWHCSRSTLSALISVPRAFRTPDSVLASLYRRVSTLRSTDTIVAPLVLVSPVSRTVVAEARPPLRSHNPPLTPSMEFLSSPIPHASCPEPSSASHPSFLYTPTACACILPTRRWVWTFF